MKTKINKKTKKLVCRVVKRFVRILLCGLLIMTQLLLVYASITAVDNVGHISKQQFNSVITDFNSRLFSFEEGLSAKIESKVNEYLSKIDVDGVKGYIINNETEITGTKDATTGTYTNVTAIEGIEVENLKLGDNIYIKDINSSNYWVSQVSPSISLNDMKQKVDLSIFYDKTEVDNLLANKQTNISGTANQVLRRNAANTGLEFSDDVKVVELSSASGTLTTDQLNILKASKLNYIKYNNYIYKYQYDSGSTRYYSMNYVYSGKVYWVYISINMSTGAYSKTDAQGTRTTIGSPSTDSLSSTVSYVSGKHTTLFSKSCSAGVYLFILTARYMGGSDTSKKSIGIGTSSTGSATDMEYYVTRTNQYSVVNITAYFSFTSTTTVYVRTTNSESGKIAVGYFTTVKLA